jgi:hypothetical protein
VSMMVVLCLDKSASIAVASPSKFSSRLELLLSPTNMLDVHFRNIAYQV